MTGATVAALVTIVFVAGACSPGEDIAEPAPQAAPTTAIDDAPTAAPQPKPTATPTPPRAPGEPTATPKPEPSADEAAVIAAWKRFMNLAMESLGKEPGDAASDYLSYMGEAALQGWVTGIENDRAAGVYITGSIESSAPRLSSQTSTSAILEMCVVTDWTGRSWSDDSLAFEEEQYAAESRARFSKVESEWILVATEFGGEECEL